MIRRTLLALLLACTPAACLAQTGPYTPLPVPDVVQNGSITYVGASVALPLNGQSSCSVNIVGVWSGTLTFQGTSDNVTWNSVQLTPYGGGTASSTTTSNNLYIGPCVALSQFRVTASSWTSGNASIGVRGAYQSGATIGSGGGGGGGGGVITGPLDGSGNVKVAEQNTITASISGTPTFNCGTGCSAQAPLTGGSTARAFAANQSIALHVSNGTTLDAVRGFTFNSVPGWLASASTMYDPVTALNASVTAAGTNPTNMVGVQGHPSMVPLQVAQPSGTLLHMDVDNFPAPNGNGINENGSGQFLEMCVHHFNATINTNNSTTQVVAAATNKTIHLCNYRMMANGTGTVSFYGGTGANCGTSQTVLEGGIPLTATGDGIAAGSGTGELFNTNEGGITPSFALCVNLQNLTGTNVWVAGSYSQR